MKITVFTPTYNRAHTIMRLYESLKSQTHKDFEWVVVDDGSSDDTEKLFNEKILNESDFSVIYKYVSNGGKHRAINMGTQLASGELFFIVDSDDFLPADSLETIIFFANSIPASEKGNFAGIAGLRGTDSGILIGTTFSGDSIDITYLDTKKYGISGDKAEVYFTDIIKKYPFPEFENEKFIMESVVWNVIGADGYLLRYFNNIVYFCEYLDDGLTKQGKEKFLTTPKGYGLFLYQSIKYGKLQKLNKWNALYEYYRMFNGKISFFDMAKNIKMNPLKLYIRLFGMRVFYKIYNR